VIPYLFLGLTLSSPHLLPEQLDSFMQRMLVSRVSRRVLAEHHISLTNALAKRDSEAEGDHVGVIYTQLSVAESVQRCWDNLQALGSIFDVPTNATSTFPDDEVRADDPIPRLVVDGHIEARFSYIKVGLATRRSI
jgi:pyruvate dehydrogenase kinase 2/3/4